MRSTVLAHALAAVAGLVQALPTPTKQEPPSKRGSLPAVAVSGNGVSGRAFSFSMRILTFSCYSFLEGQDPVLHPRRRLPTGWFLGRGGPPGGHSRLSTRCGGLQEAGHQHGQGLHHGQLGQPRHMHECPG